MRSPANRRGFPYPGDNSRDQGAMAIPAPIQTFIDAQADNAPGEYGDLRAVIFNGTLKRSPARTHPDGLLAIARGVMERVGVRVDAVRTADHEIPPGVWPDMTTQG